MAMRVEERLLSVSEVLRVLGIPRHRLVYLFESRKLRPEEFLTLDNGQKVFRTSDLERIKQTLFEIQSKG